MKVVAEGMEESEATTGVDSSSKLPLRPPSARQARKKNKTSEEECPATPVEAVQRRQRAPKPTTKVSPPDFSTFSQSKGR